MTQLKVSVVVPAYNEEKFIGRCLDSLMQQEVKPDEIIVVNNNSKDSTGDIAQKYPVKVLLEEKQGLIYARNRGYNEAQYEIIARCDADTFVPKDWVKRIKENFENSDFDAFSGPVHFYDAPLLSGKINLHILLFFKLTKLILGHETLFGPNMALRKDIWNKVKDRVCLKDNQVHEDMDLTMHIAPYGKIGYIKDLVVDTSLRRLKSHPTSILFEYPFRWVKTLKFIKHTL